MRPALTGFFAFVLVAGCGPQSEMPPSLDWALGTHWGYSGDVLGIEFREDGTAELIASTTCDMNTMPYLDMTWEPDEDDTVVITWTSDPLHPIREGDVFERGGEECTILTPWSEVWGRELPCPTQDPQFGTCVTNGCNPVGYCALD